MSKCLVIGSTVCDVMIYVDELPNRQGDAHIKKQFFSLGGCAFNVVNILHHLGGPYDFISPVGTGLYGQFVSKRLLELGIDSPIQLPGENGCCYCFIESDGERTFLSEHGVEYQFDSGWLSGLDLSGYDYVYVCGLEVEEETGPELLESLKTIPSQLIFAPGPRGHLIPKQRLDDLLKMKPILHLNEEESLRLSGEDKVDNAVMRLYQITHQTVIVTRGIAGVVAFDGKWHILPTYPNKIVDTIGAGDSHVGAMMAALSQKKSLDASLDFANQVSSRIIGTSGVHLSEEEFKKLQAELDTKL
ncbi:Sugar or nucleoside kinase, ribokinase family [Streptococcus henryi]|uniref:Sugar or nucleoside kinase, ribokinase family n=1 Tax=Streptococcus henryi TaxID=439219 RepID=A0A1G6C6G0_9STRE|nr:PfkB family carbohydrate kinase [Streptococcus henryi]SDB28476.1 Sugar or nucleoside kinase, ribokinase family [Streptococcus henryi]